MPRTVPKKDRFFGLFEKLRQPDITGVTIGAQIRDGKQQEECYGAFSYVETHDGKIAGGTSFWASSIRFDARKANAIYKDIPLPQVPALRLLAIIKS